MVLNNMREMNVRKISKHKKCCSPLDNPNNKWYDQKFQPWMFGFVGTEDVPFSTK